MSKSQSFRKNLRSDRTNVLKNAASVRMVCCNAFDGKLIVAQRPSNRKPIRSFCETAELTEQEKPLKEISAEDLRLSIWRRILKEDGLIKQVSDTIVYESEDGPLEIYNEGSMRMVLNGMHRLGMNRFEFVVTSSDQGKLQMFIHPSQAMRLLRKFSC